MAKLKILIGVSGSGKSTFSKNEVDKNPKTVIVSRDSLRYAFQNKYVCSQKFEDLLTDLTIQQIKTFLSNGFDVILDNTNLRKDYIDTYIKEFNKISDIEFILFELDEQRCRIWNKQRDKVVPDDVITRQIEQYKTLMKDLKDYQMFLPKINKTPYQEHTELQYFKNGDKEECVIFDLDGTLFLSDGRNMFDMTRVDEDKVNIFVKEQVDFHKSKGRKIILLSGREETGRDLTIKSLNENDILFDGLYMRTASDNRKDSIIKKELYQKYIKDRYNVYCVYDDRLQVVQLWYELGLFIFNVNQGNKIF